MKIEEKMADEDDKESLRSLEQQNTDVRFPEMERVRSPKRSTEDNLDDDDTREHKRQTVALISEIPRFTIGVICQLNTVLKKTSTMHWMVLGSNEERLPLK